MRPYSRQSGHPVTVGGGVGVGVGVVSVVPTFTHLALQPFASVIFTAMAQLPDAGAVHFILFVPCPAVIAPLSMVHTYVAPGPASFTEALLPVEPVGTIVGAVIVQSGNVCTVTTFQHVLLHPFSSVIVTV